jgi:hypothetical protein
MIFCWSTMLATNQYYYPGQTASALSGEQFVVEDEGVVTFKGFLFDKNFVKSLPKRIKPTI